MIVESQALVLVVAVTVEAAAATVVAAVKVPISAAVLISAATAEALKAYSWKWWTQQRSGLV
jgi:hypothetical protein